MAFQFNAFQNQYIGAGIKAFQVSVVQADGGGVAQGLGDAIGVWLPGDPTYDHPIGHGLRSDYGKRLPKSRLIIGRR